MPPLANPDHLEDADAGHDLPHVDLARRLRRRAGKAGRIRWGSAAEGWLMRPRGAYVMGTMVPVIPDAPIGHFRLTDFGGKSGYLAHCEKDSPSSQ